MMDGEPPTAAPGLSVQDPPNADAQRVFLALQFQKLEPRPGKPKKQHKSMHFQDNPEKVVWSSNQFCQQIS